MSNDTKQTNAAPCGAVAAVLMAPLERITTNADGTVTVLGVTRGDNENNFPIEVRASEIAAQQILCEVDKAKAKEMPGIKIWAHGPCEVDFDTSKEGDQRVLKLCIAADLVRSAHPLMKVEPLQNSGVFFGSPSVASGESQDDRGNVRKWFKGSLEFPHLSTKREEKNSSPAAAKLTGTSAEALSEQNGTDLMVSGRFTRQTGEVGGNAFDHISLSVSTACEIRIPGGTPRQAPKATASNTVQTADYEAGYSDSNADLEAAKAEFASMDF